MKNSRNSRLGNGLVLSLGLVLASSSAASAASLYVANNGLDSGSCGSKSDPCRSITQGIANAAAGGTVIVGPGTYGDLDGNGTLGEAGEEVSGLVASDTCMLVIDKAVTVVSSAGAWSTVIQPAQFDFSPSPVDATVCITAEGVQFGAYGKGFTIAPPSASANTPFASLSVNSAGVGAVVAGNVTYCSATSSYGISSSPTGVQLLQNRVTGGCGVGMSVTGGDVVVSGNSASASLTGVSVFGSGTTFDGNVLASNFVGLRVYGAIAVTRSSFTGNRGIGIELNTGSNGSVTTSNLVGNGVASGTNCGISDSFSLPVTVDGNWWGTATGPGSDPADTKCSGPLPASFAEKAVSVKLKGTR